MFKYVTIKYNDIILFIKVIKINILIFVIKNNTH